MKDEDKIAQLLKGKNNWTRAMINPKTGIRYDFTRKDREGGLRVGIDLLYQYLSLENPDKMKRWDKNQTFRRSFLLGSMQIIFLCCSYVFLFTVAQGFPNKTAR